MTLVPQALKREPLARQIMIRSAQLIRFNSLPEVGSAGLVALLLW